MTRAARLVLAASLTAAILCSASCSTTSRSTASSKPGDVTTQVLTVKDLVFPAAPAAANAPTPPAWISLEHLAANLREATDPKYWATEGVGIRTEASGYVEVTANARMQEQVVQVLADMRELVAKKRT